jgi:hypothetical protein
MAAGYDVPGLRVFQGETVEDAMNRVPGEYRHLFNAFSQTSQTLAEAYESLNQYQAQTATLRSLEIKLHATENALRVCKIDLEYKRGEASDKRDMLKTQTMLGEHNVKHRREKNDLQSRIQQLQREHTDQLRDQPTRFHEEKEDMKSWHAEQIRKGRTDAGQRQQHEIDRLNKQLTDERWQ